MTDTERKIAEINATESKIVSDVCDLLLEKGLNKSDSDAIISALYQMSEIGFEKARL